MLRKESIVVLVASTSSVVTTIGFRGFMLFVVAISRRPVHVS